MTSSCALAATLLLLLCSVQHLYVSGFCSSSSRSSTNSFNRNAFRRHSFSERTESIFKELDARQVQQSGGAGGTTTLDGLRNLNNAWLKLKDGGWADPPTQIVTDQSSMTYRIDDPGMNFDICVAGGTLGVFYAAAFQKLGYKTCVIERGKVVGRSQEWNISRKELGALVRLNILTAEDIEAIISIEFNPVRVGFKTDTSPDTRTPGFELYVNDILNLGIKPDALIALMRQKYLALGGTLFEGEGLKSVSVFSNTAQLQLTSEKSLTARLVLDAMGNASPISKQIRGSVEPDGICIVVGSCARGFEQANNTYSDVIYTDTPITTKSPVSSLQYFWEAFPAGKFDLICCFFVAYPTCPYFTLRIATAKR